MPKSGVREFEVTAKVYFVRDRVRRDGRSGHGELYGLAEGIADVEFEDGSRAEVLQSLTGGGLALRHRDSTMCLSVKAFVDACLLLHGTLDDETLAEVTEMALGPDLEALAEGP
jgi:hypothetical protein